MGRSETEAASPVHPLPEEFLWPRPQWVRVDRLKAHTIRFAARVVIGGLIGLLFGRVLGSLQGLFLQWVYEGLVRSAPVIESTLGSALHVVALVIGTVFSPFLRWSPLEKTFAEVRTGSDGTVALLFLAQVHGSLNGLYQGLKPAIGSRAQMIIEPIILSWGLLWYWLSWPVRAVIFRRPTIAELQLLLKSAAQPEVAKRLDAFARRGLLPVSGQEQWSESETLEAWPGKIPVEKRREFWWARPGIRLEIYRWIEQASETRALPLLMHGLHDPDESARRAAVAALASLGTPETIPYLLPLLAEDRETGSLAAEGLKRCAQWFGE